ncbi:hypothetical protein LEP1GSC085_2309 [Leptospira interrogans str. L0996]|nr:hypothetical protein LEP1GSC085_2309 [Leptospira interrogans str. L0996]
MLEIQELKDNPFRFWLGSNTQFLKDLTTVAFGSKKVGGPYKESEKCFCDVRWKSIRLRSIIPKDPI